MTIVFCWLDVTCTTETETASCLFLFYYISLPLIYFVLHLQYRWRIYSAVVENFLHQRNGSFIRRPKLCALAFCSELKTDVLVNWLVKVLMAMCLLNQFEPAINRRSEYFITPDIWCSYPVCIGAFMCYCIVYTRAIDDMVASVPSDTLFF